MWQNMLHRRLSPKNEGPKRLDRRVQTGDVLGNFLKKARSAYGVSYKEEKHTDVIYYHRENRLIRDFAKLSELSSEFENS